MIESNDLFWLIGYLEGEGSFLKGSPSHPNQPAISVCSTDEDVIQRVAKLFEVGHYEIQKKKKKKNWKRTWATRKRGYHAVELMQMLMPHMSLRRQDQIKRAIDSYDKNSPRKLSISEVKKVRELCQTGMTQAEIGKLVGTSRETVNKIKNFRKYKNVI